MPPTEPPTELKLLEKAALQLSEMRDFNEVRKIRDRAEAARKYAQTAAMSLKIQNWAAELKLRAERRAGQILNELLPHGGNRRSSYHRGNLKLTDIGINSNQSARWRREAAVPEIVFQQYISTSNRLCEDITARGLLRLEKAISQKGDASPSSRRSTGARARDGSVTPNPRWKQGLARQLNGKNDASTEELLGEITNHRRLLEQVVEPFRSGHESKLSQGERRLVLRLLAEMSDLLKSLKQCVLG